MIASCIMQWCGSLRVNSPSRNAPLNKVIGNLKKKKTLFTSARNVRNHMPIISGKQTPENCYYESYINNKCRLGVEQLQRTSEDLPRPLCKAHHIPVVELAGRFIKIESQTPISPRCRQIPWQLFSGEIFRRSMSEQFCFETSQLNVVSCVHWIIYCTKHKF